MSEKVWLQPQIIDRTQIILDSFKGLLGYELISREKDLTTQAEELFKADFVVVAHGIENDPIFDYGNQTALDLWVMDWKQFTQTPSKATVEPSIREAREIMLQQVATRGYLDNYGGVRISSSGRKFYIREAIIWNLTDNLGNKCGQAATFSDWQFLEQ